MKIIIKINKQGKMLFHSFRFKYSTHINWSIILFPLCYSNNNKGGKKVNKFNLLVNYAKRKLCIKDVILKSNEIEKLKIFLFDSSSHKKFEKLKNHLPKEKNDTNIWDYNQRDILLKE